VKSPQLLDTHDNPVLSGHAALLDKKSILTANRTFLFWQNRTLSFWDYTAGRSLVKPK